MSHNTAYNVRRDELVQETADKVSALETGIGNRRQIIENLKALARRAGNSGNQ